MPERGARCAVLAEVWISGQRPAQPGEEAGDAAEAGARGAEGGVGRGLDLGEVAGVEAEPVAGALEDQGAAVEAGDADPAGEVARRLARASAPAGVAQADEG